jgi:hypothetical protein
VLLVNRFKLKNIFNTDELADMVETFGLKRHAEHEIEAQLQSAFSDYILVSLSEFGSQGEDHRKLYIESEYHLDKAKKLLEGLPHPAGKMAYRLSSMIDTLNKLVEGNNSFSAERASRFVEKNLVRRLRDIWISNTATPFYAGSDGWGKSPRDYLLCCFSAAGKQYPELCWFKSVDGKIADQLIKSIKR